MTIGYGILKDAAKVSITYLKRLRHFCRLWRYKRKSARPPITHEEAMEIAYITLAGKIIKAIPYQNMESKTIYIAVSYKLYSGILQTQSRRLCHSYCDFGTSWRFISNTMEYGLSHILCGIWSRRYRWWWNSRTSYEIPWDGDRIINGLSYCLFTTP